MTRLNQYRWLLILAALFIMGCKHGGDTPEPAPDPVKPFKYVHVRGNQVLSPAGRPVFLTVATWENPFEGRVSEKTIMRFMAWMQQQRLNCILIKANWWLIHDDRRPNRNNVNVIHRLVRDAQSKGIYVILNLCDVWGRGRGGNQFDVDSRRHPINVWDRAHKNYAETYIKWVAREFKRHPMLLFEIGNEMAVRHSRAEVENYKWIARKMLTHFYNIAGRDRPIGVSQQGLWDLPVNILFNHNVRIPGVSSRPVGTNEAAFDKDWWKDARIRDPGYQSHYYTMFEKAYRKGHFCCAAATILDINRFFSDPSAQARKVLMKLGTYSRS